MFLSFSGTEVFGTSMEIKTNVDEVQNYREHKVFGAITKESLFSYLGELYSSSEFNPNMNILWDLRDADLSSFSLPEVVSVRNYVEDSLKQPKALKASLVVSSQLNFTLARMCETLLKGSAVKVKSFFDIDDAKRWIVS
jgi:hypothetical protein